MLSTIKLLFTVLSYDVTVDSWQWRHNCLGVVHYYHLVEVGRSSVGGSRGWTSKLQSGSMSVINSLMERKWRCGPFVNMLLSARLTTTRSIYCHPYMKCSSCIHVVTKMHVKCLLIDCFSKFEVQQNVYWYIAIFSCEFRDSKLQMITTLPEATRWRTLQSKYYPAEAWIMPTSHHTFYTFHVNNFYFHAVPEYIFEQQIWGKKM